MNKAIYSVLFSEFRQPFPQDCLTFRLKTKLKVVQALFLSLHEAKRNLWGFIPRCISTWTNIGFMNSSFAAVSLHIVLTWSSL